MLLQLIDDSSTIVFSAIQLYLKGLYDANVATTQRTSLWLSCSKWPISLITKTRHCQWLQSRVPPPLTNESRITILCFFDFCFSKIIGYAIFLGPLSCLWLRRTQELRNYSLLGCQNEATSRSKYTWTLPKCTLNACYFGSQFTDILVVSLTLLGRCWFRGPAHRSVEGNIKEKPGACSPWRVQTIKPCYESHRFTGFNMTPTQRMPPKNQGNPSNFFPCICCLFIISPFNGCRLMTAGRCKSTRNCRVRCLSMSTNDLDSVSLFLSTVQEIKSEIQSIYPITDRWDDCILFTYMNG